MSDNEDQRTSFRFLDLPSELRNNIYEKAFEDIVTIKGGKALAPGILLACKQVHDEAVMVFYESTTFYFVDFNDGKGWYTQIHNKYRDVVSKLRYDYVEEAKLTPRRQCTTKAEIIRYLQRRVSPPRLEARRRIEEFWTSVERNGSTRRQGALKASEVLLLKDISHVDEICDEPLSKDAADSKHKKLRYKVWVGECGRDHEIQDSDQMCKSMCRHE